MWDSQGLASQPLPVCRRSPQHAEPLLRSSTLPAEVLRPFAHTHFAQSQIPVRT